MIREFSLYAGPQGAIEPLVVRPGTVTIVVGPNHSGKSLFLREIHQKADNESSSHSFYSERLAHQASETNESGQRRILRIVASIVASAMFIFRSTGSPFGRVVEPGHGFSKPNLCFSTLLAFELFWEICSPACVLRALRVLPDSEWFTSARSTQLH